MVCDHTLKGLVTNLRSADLKDAEFTWEIRQDAKRTRHLHAVRGSLIDQMRWLEGQRNREGDYFFIVEDSKGIPIGTTSIYNINNDVAEFGRLVLNGNPVQNVDAAIATWNFGFNELKLSALHMRVFTENILAFGLDKRLGGKIDHIEFNQEFSLEEAFLIASKDSFGKAKEKIFPYLERYLAAETAHKSSTK